MIRLEKNSSTPFYLQLKECLRRDVERGVYAADAPIPDERSLAERLGLSRMTVRRAIVELTAEGLFKRIPGRGTFVCLPTTATASSTAKRAIGVVSLMDQFEIRSALFYHRIMQAIHQALGVGNSLVLKKASPPYAALVKELREDETLAGLVILGVVDQALLNALAGAALPMVLVDSSQPEGVRLDQVLQDGESASFDAVSALIALGHRDIAIMNYPPTPAAAQRQAGYERALKAHNIPLKSEFIYEVQCNSTAGYAAMRRVLKSPHIPTAVFCTTDDFAIAVVSAVKDHGWRVPEHLSVAGFGDVGHFCTPPLSTVRMPMEQMGHFAVKLLNERIQNPRLEPRSMILSNEWMPRSTCDLPRSS